MARPKRDQATQAPAAPEAEQSGEHRRTNARAPTVPFQMVTRRRGAQQRTSGGSEDHHISHDDLVSAKEETDAASVPPAMAPPAANGPEHVGVGNEVAPTAEPDAGEAPRRSSRVVPKKAAPQKPSLVVALHLRPELLRQALEGLPAEAPGRREEDFEPPTPRAKRPKQVSTDQAAQQTSSSAAAPLPAEEADARAPSQKRARRPKQAVSYAEDSESPERLPTPEEEEEGPPPKRRRKYTRRVPAADAAADDTQAPISEPVVEAAAPAASASSGAILASLPVEPVTPAPTQPMQMDDVSEERKSPEKLQAGESTPDERQGGKRRGRPPKAELVRRALQQKQQEEEQQYDKMNHTQLYLPKPPPLQPALPPPSPDSLASQFRAAIPEGLNMDDVLTISKHMRDKELKSRKRQMKRLVKRGYRVEHRVTRESCNQRSQRLVVQQRKLDRHLRRANLGLLDQTIAQLSTSEEYLSANGPAAPFFNEGERQAALIRQKQIEIANFRRECEEQLAERMKEASKYLSDRAFARSIPENLEKLEEQKQYLSSELRKWAKEHPDEVDAIIERCSESGEDVNTAIQDAAFDGRSDIDDVIEKIWNGRGRGPIILEGSGDDDVEMGEAGYSNLRGGDDEEYSNVRGGEDDGEYSNLRGGDNDDEGYTNIRGGSPAPTAMPVEDNEEEQRPGVSFSALVDVVNQEVETKRKETDQEAAFEIFIQAAIEQERLKEKSKSPIQAPEEPPADPHEEFEQPSPAPSFRGRMTIPSASPAPSFGGSTDERSSTRVFEESAEPGFALSGPAPPPDVLKPSSLYSEVESRSRFTSNGEPRRWSESRRFPSIERMERPSFSPLQTTHHHYLPGVSPPPLLSAGSSTHSLPPPSAMSSPGRVLPSPVPSTRFPAAYQAVSQQQQRSPSPGFFNQPPQDTRPQDTRPHEPRFRGDRDPSQNR
ncbi:hypothetical protein AA313_de0209632 [Arthrobotrys entomopaga]|nr:hypothetical protein AA313_de0209632 [Arthrobotrys entomopaga]